MGWTQHSVGVQYIRAAAILQALLGNIGRPGGGIMALRGHASIQGSTDIPTLFNILPGYLPMPAGRSGRPWPNYIAPDVGVAGFWGDMPTYIVSLLKAWFGDAATAENDYGFDWLPRLTGDHGNYRTALDMVDGKVPGYIVAGENPAVGSANGRMQRLGLAKAEWLVVRDFACIETATFWKNSPESSPGSCAPRTSAPRCSSCPRPTTWRRTARSPTPSDCCSGGTRPSSRPATPAAICGSSTTSAGSSRSGWPTPTTRVTPRSRL